MTPSPQRLPPAEGAARPRVPRPRAATTEHYVVYKVFVRTLWPSATPSMAHYRCYCAIDDPSLAVTWRRQAQAPPATRPFCRIYSLVLDNPKHFWLCRLSHDSRRCGSLRASTASMWRWCCDADPATFARQPPRVRVVSVGPHRGRRHLEPASLRDQERGRGQLQRRSHAAKHVTNYFCRKLDQVSQFYQGGTCGDTAARRKRLLAQCSQIPDSTYPMVTKGGTSVVRIGCI